MSQTRMRSNSGPDPSTLDYEAEFQARELKVHDYEQYKIPLL